MHQFPNVTDLSHVYSSRNAKWLNNNVAIRFTTLKYYDSFVEIHNYISNKDITYFLLLISYKFEIYYFVSYNYTEKKKWSKDYFFATSTISNVLSNLHNNWEQKVENKLENVFIRDEDISLKKSLGFRIGSNEFDHEIGWISRGMRVSRCGMSTRCWNVKRFRTHFDSGGVPVAAFEAASSFFSRPEAAQTAPANNLWRLPLVNCTRPPEGTYCMMYDAVHSISKSSFPFLLRHDY